MVLRDVSIWVVPLVTASIPQVRNNIGSIRNRKMKRQILISSLILLSIQTLAAAVLRHVPSRDYPTIQSAIDAAVNGDMVVVCPGIYTGTGNVNLDFGGKAITVRSQINPANPNLDIIAATIIDCQREQIRAASCFLVS